MNSTMFNSPYSMSSIAYALQYKGISQLYPKLGPGCHSQHKLIMFIEITNCFTEATVIC